MPCSSPRFTMSTTDADFVYCSFGRSYGLVVTPERHTTISANIDYGQPWRQSFGDNLVYTDWHRDNFFVAVRELVPARGRVGIEFDHVTLQKRKKLSAALPEVVFVDIGEAAMRMRMVKSEEELALIRGGAAGVRRGRTGLPGSDPRGAFPSTRSRCTPRRRWSGKSRSATRTPS